MINRTLLAISLVLASTAICALTEEQFSALKQNLANSDPAIRRGALEELKKESPKTAGNNIVPLLSYALADKDAQVRASAASILARISFSTLSKFNPPNQIMTGYRAIGRSKPHSSQRLTIRMKRLGKMLLLPTL